MTVSVSDLDRIRGELDGDSDPLRYSVHVNGEPVGDGVGGGVIVSVTDGSRDSVSWTVLVTVT